MELQAISGTDEDIFALDVKEVGMMVRGKAVHRSAKHGETILRENFAVKIDDQRRFAIHWGSGARSVFQLPEKSR